MRVCKSFTFEAAHRLQNHDGKCRNLHGHSYQVDVEVHCDILNTHGPSEGMVMDFGRLSEWWKIVEPTLDHVTILERGDPLIVALRDFGGINLTLCNWPPTAERIADWLLVDLMDHFERHSQWFSATHGGASIRVHETAKSWAEASREYDE